MGLGGGMFLSVTLVSIVQSLRIADKGTWERLLVCLAGVSSGGIAIYMLAHT
jgi:hypothetical protein